MSESQTFWEHLDELRSSLIRMIIALSVCSIVAFCFKDYIFNIILAPQNSNFFTYRLLEQIGNLLSSMDDMEPSSMSVHLINTGLAQQFLIHVKVSVYVGIMMASPYIICLLFRFISPALYSNEKQYASRLVISGYLMFILGVMLSYFLIFPLTFRFLGTYQVSQIVENAITIESYIDTLLTICLSMGIVFEIPVLCWIMGRMGIINASIMRCYRRHVVVILLVIAAIITPTSDVFTLTIVSLPMWLLYEASIYIVKRAGR